MTNKYGRNTREEKMVKARKKKEKDILDQILDTIDFKGLTQDEVIGQDGLIKQLTGRILQKALEAELTEHLGYEKNSSAGDNSGNSRNDHTDGMSDRDIKAHLEKIYNVEVAAGTRQPQANQGAAIVSVTFSK